jgi:hypothetical protein
MPTSIRNRPENQSGEQAVNGVPPLTKTSRDIGETLAIILALGIAGEVIVPWAVIELSDLVLFNVPFWALWPIFAGPLTLALATALVVWLVRTRGTAPRERRLSSAATDGHTTAQQRHPNHQ